MVAETEPTTERLTTPELIGRQRDREAASPVEREAGKRTEPHGPPAAAELLHSHLPADEAPSATLMRLTARLQHYGLRVQRLPTLHGALAETLLADLTVAVGALGAAEVRLHQEQQHVRALREELVQEQRRCQRLFDLALDAYVITDPAGIIRDASPAASRLVRCARRYLRNKPLAALVYRTDQARFAAQLARLQESSGDHVQEWTCRFPARSHDQERQTRIRVATIRDDDGELTALAWLIRDVTDELRLEQQVRAQEAELERRVRQRTLELEALLRLKEATSAAGASAGLRQLDCA